MITLWLRGLLRERPLRLWGAATGIMLTVAFLALLLSFIASGNANMTRRAAASVPVDWQVLLGQNTTPAAAEQAIKAATAIKTLLPVQYADVASFTANTGGTVQTTGAGKVLGLPNGYRTAFPSEIRPLIGSPDGVVISQQTAANLHAAVGDMINIGRYGAASVLVTVAGVVDLPQADSLFQAVGAPKGLAPQAPPDNVLLLPQAQFDQLFAPQRLARPDTVKTELHIRLATVLPSDPGRAFALVGALANNVEARLSGGAVVGDTLGVTLDGARENALYAQALFLFLGLPGAILAATLTLSVASASAAQRQSEAALLRVRGASERLIVQLGAAEALTVGLVGTVLGLVLFVVLSPLLTGGLSGGWLAYLLPVLAGLSLALLAVLLPTYRAVRSSTVAAQRQAVGRVGVPLWQRLYLDLILLVVAAAEFWRSAAGGYQLVLAPEGVTKASIQLEAFVAPLALWLGGTLLGLRLLGWLLGKGRLTGLLRPFGGNLSATVASVLERQRPLLLRGAALVSLAGAFAVSTSIFNATYNDQARVDAVLTNGSDVTVTGNANNPAGPHLADLQKLPGVVKTQPLIHRFAYVGADLQDIYGIDAAHFTDVSRLADSYFKDITATQALDKLKATPNAIFVSQETVNDYQLSLGDTLKLRLLNAKTHLYSVVPFSLAGVVREFPTAPKDSFLVTNASYVAQMTGNPVAEVALLQISGNPQTVVSGAQQLLSGVPGIQVTDLAAVRGKIASGLTAVNLAGLSRIELAFAALLLAASTGLVLALGLSERRRTFTVLSALGAKASQLGAFLSGEALVVVGLGGAFGLALGLGVAQTLIKLLQGVFDPPPEALLLPWAYLVALLFSAGLSTWLALRWARAASARRVTEVLRAS
ncbi:ABC transporter permease [Deinococcus detaillensis]|uniref:ABC transporter permease n=1 Tax=Deinococcus detaillensis TaxID=2592048 RepID=A0A553UH31_9DEIO|nr:ABC transporter permease [Deinococcus detaillensis]TSA79517.1 ABC transporter permease [Deinococcus detaillensis]